MENLSLQISKNKKENIRSFLKYITHDLNIKFRVCLDKNSAYIQMIQMKMDDVCSNLFTSISKSEYYKYSENTSFSFRRRPRSYGGFKARFKSFREFLKEFDLSFNSFVVDSPKQKYSYALNAFNNRKLQIINAYKKQLDDLDQKIFEINKLIEDEEKIIDIPFEFL